MIRIPNYLNVFRLTYKRTTQTIIFKNQNFTTTTKSNPIQWKLTNSTSPPRYDTGCTFCQPNLPSDKPINFKQPLSKSSVIPDKHILSLTTTPSNDISNFNSKIEEIPGTLAHRIHGLKSEKQIGLKFGITLSSIVLENHQNILEKYGVKESNDQLVFIYPDMKIVKFPTKDIDQFLKKYDLIEDQSKQEVYNPFKTVKDLTIQHKTNPIDDIKIKDSNFKEFPIEKDLIVTCGHAKRDIRCGQLGPLITNEFNKVLKEKNLKDNTYLGQISHIGGHAFAGNVLYYPKETQSTNDFIWYGRVFPQDVQSLVDDTVIDKKIIKNLYRGDLEKIEKLACK
ncbi:AIM32 [Candida pseudojiufengensis]|uniref:AIM32 n=1 Tax=Candida pseudojiufengensis TaxID=497109 RepID=UPI00222482A4|nr:AIM32 [Candida pseudojiufengensis]KAI5962678.1 AIM32 [Candida pseudojiufengensis]